MSLIYFAAYPTISDNCESHYFNEVENHLDRRWEQQYFTLARDIMYYANCELSDTIIYHLNKIEKVKRGLKLFCNAQNYVKGCVSSCRKALF